MEINQRKQVLDSFQQYLLQQFELYCQKHSLVKDEQGIINFIIDKDLIPTVNLYQFTVIEEYEKISNTSSLKKTRIVELIADKYNISERTVWNILKKAERKKSSTSN